MLQVRRSCWIGAAVLLIGFDATARADETERDFRAAKTSITQQMRDRKPEVRVAAVQKLREFPLVDAAKVLLFQGCTSTHEDVQHASFQALAAFKDQQEVCSYLKNEVTRDLKKGPLELGTAAALGTLLAAELAGSPQEVQQLLDRSIQAAGGPAMLVTLVDELGIQGDAAALRSLSRLAELPLFQGQFGPRRAMVQALIHIQLPDAVTALVNRLPTVQGETRADILRHLSHLNGQALETDDECRAWWQQSQGTFIFPPQGAIPGAVAAGKGVPTYYGLPLYGAKIVFVLDTSSSMRGGRIVAAERELVKAIGDLPGGVQFNVLAFNGTVAAWQSQLVTSSPMNKEAATRFVLAQPLGSLTASFDALDSALSFDTESIYFLTDGAPTAGKIKQPAEIVAALTKANRLRRITVNAIGIGVGPEGNKFDVFLRSLADMNFGAYRRVDE